MRSLLDDSLARFVLMLGVMSAKQLEQCGSLERGQYKHFFMTALQFGRSQNLDSISSKVVSFPVRVD